MGVQTNPSKNHNMSPDSSLSMGVAFHLGEPQMDAFGSVSVQQDSRRIIKESDFRQRTFIQRVKHQIIIMVCPFVNIFF